MAPKETMKLKTSKRSRSSKTARRSHSVNDASDGSDSSKTIVEVSDSSCDSPDKKPKVTVGLGDGYVLEVTVGSGDAPDEECLRRVEEETQHRLADVAPYDPSVPMAVAKAKAVAKARRDGTLAPEDSGLACSSSSFKDEIGVWVDAHPWNRRGPSAIPDTPPPITLTPKAHNHLDMPPPDGFDHDKADDTMRKVYKEHREQMVLAQQGRWHHAESLQRTRVMESLQVYQPRFMRIMDSDGDPHHAESLQGTRVMESLQVYKADGIMRVMDSDGDLEFEDGKKAAKIMEGVLQRGDQGYQEAGQKIMDGLKAEAAYFPLAEQGMMARLMEAHDARMKRKDDKKDLVSDDHSVAPMVGAVLRNSESQAQTNDAEPASCQQEASQLPLEESYVPDETQDPFHEYYQTGSYDFIDEGQQYAPHDGDETQEA